MSNAGETYFQATRHPWPSLVLLLPWLAAYEIGMFALGSGEAEAFRSGADSWLRLALQGCGLQETYWAPVAVVGLLLGWTWFRRHDRPQDLLSLILGMSLESILFAVGLWGISRGLAPFLQSVGLPLQLAIQTKESLVHVLSFVGAGIYEEVVFRLILFFGLILLLQLTCVPRALAIGFAAVLSATVFAAAHHVGPAGEAFDSFVFLFRTLAGLYFALLCQFRGFGIAVGTHACYDVFVGVMIG